MSKERTWEEVWVCSQCIALIRVHSGNGAFPAGALSLAWPARALQGHLRVERGADH